MKLFSKNQNKFFLLWSSALALTVCFQVSCKKNEASTDNLFVYFPSGNSGYNIYNSGEITVYGSTIISNKENLAFPVFLTRPLNKDVSITAIIDSSIIRLYDEQYKPASPTLSLPDGAFELESNQVIVKSGNTSSQDSLKIRIKDAKKLIGESNNYIIPIIIKSSDQNVSISNNRQIMFVKLSVKTVNVGISSLDISNTIDISLKNLNNVNSGTDLVQLNAKLNTQIPQDIVVQIDDEPALVEAYNTSNKTNYVKFPQGAYEVQKSEVKIPANTLISTEKFQIKLTDINKFEIGKSYLLCLKIRKDESPNAIAVDKNFETVYIRITIFRNNIDVNTATIIGTKIPRTGWTISQFSTQEIVGEYAPASNLIDDSANTFWHSIWSTPQPDGAIPSLPQYFVINMGKQNTIKSLIYLNRANSITGQPSNIQISTSLDGTNWTDQGFYQAELQTTNYSNPKIIRFIEPVVAQYFKFNIINTHGNTKYTFLSDVSATE